MPRFDQHGWHIRTGQNGKRCTHDIDCGAGCTRFKVPRDRVGKVRCIRDMPLLEAIPLKRYPVRGGKIPYAGFSKVVVDAPHVNLASAAPPDMQTDEKSRIPGIGHRCPGREIDAVVAGSCQKNRKIVPEQLGYSPCEQKGDILFHNPSGPGHTRIMAAAAGIENDNRSRRGFGCFSV